MLTALLNTRFFDTPSECLSDFQRMHWAKRAASFAQSWATLIHYRVNKLFLRLSGAGGQMHPYATGDNITLSEKKLIVCLHGLNSSPLQFKHILEGIHRRAPEERNVYIPHIRDKGNAPLDDMVDPVFEKIEKWAQAGGEKELVLVGISNGGRIARAIEARLRTSDCKRNLSSLRFVSIVGACKGSTLSNLAHRLHLSRLMSPNIAAEMPTDSKRFAQLNQDLAKAPDYYDCRRDYTFFASPHDWMVPNYDSTLMDVTPFLARYAIIPGHGHNSIPYAKADEISEAILA